MNLAPLMAVLSPCAVHGLEGEGPAVTALHYRSQEVQPGGVFVAIRGQVADGHDFIDDARRRGAVAVVTEKPVAGSGVVVTVPDTRRALAELAAAFYGRPSEQLTVVAVTGTNGKTTTTYLVEGILMQAGRPTGVIGTINYRHSGISHPSPTTTPESLDLQRILAEMQAAGVSHVVLEASSHAIELQRIHACWMDIGVFTNLSQDHLDFHGSMPAYWATKKRLFTHFLAAGPKAGRAVAVVNTDSGHGRELAEQAGIRVIRAGTGTDCSVRGENWSCDLQGIRGAIVFGARRIDIRSRLVGRHNIENLLCAAGVGAALGIDPRCRAKAVRAAAGPHPGAQGFSQPDLFFSGSAARRSFRCDGVDGFGAGADPHPRLQQLPGSVRPVHPNFAQDPRRQPPGGGAPGGSRSPDQPVGCGFSAAADR